MARPIPLPASDRTLGRFWTKVIRTDDADCWIWCGSRNAEGYGWFGIAGQTYKAHRCSYAFAHGDVHPDLHLDHLCRNKSCVNPAHLEPVTNRENILRGRLAEVNRARSAISTHCQRGHLMAGENVVPLKNGRRACRECKRFRARNWWRKTFQQQSAALR